ncbi:MAG: DUF6465 family protein [Lachnospiraceae bacterium]|nr:DUF6465 family protein [Lachnospiraceae bacterium]
MAETKKPVAVAPAAEKKAEPAAAAKKPAVKKAATKKEAVKKTVAAKPAAAKKTAAKPAAAKKAPAKKVETKATMVVQFDGADLFDADALKARAIKDYKKNTKEDAKKMDIYVNVNEKMVYYVVDDYNGSFEV